MLSFLSWDTIQLRISLVADFPKTSIPPLESSHKSDTGGYKQPSISLSIYSKCRYFVTSSQVFEVLYTY